MKRLCTTAIAAFLLALPVGTTATIQNGDFEGGFVPVNEDQCPTSWTMYETQWGGGGEGSVITSQLDNGPSMPGQWSTLWTRFNGGASGDWTAIEQRLDAIVHPGHAEYVGLTFDLKVLYHDLGGSGWTADDWEFPFSVMVKFTDENDQIRYWQHGYYYFIDDATGPAPQGTVVAGGQGIVYSTQVPQGVWISQSFNLLAQLRTLAEPMVIHEIRFGGSGWNFEGQVDNVGLFTGPTPIESRSFGAVKSLYR